MPLGTVESPSTPTPAPTVAQQVAQNVANQSVAEQLAAANARLRAVEDAGKAAAKTAALANALSSLPLVQGAQEHLSQLLAPQVTLHEEGGQYIATGPAMAPLADHLKTIMGRPEYSMFLRPSNPQGGTASGASSGAHVLHTPGGFPAQAHQPRNLGEALLASGVNPRGFGIVPPVSTEAPPGADLRRPFGLPQHQLALK
jgi:hypothetical protein